MPDPDQSTRLPSERSDREHHQTEKCGFDRNGSHSAGHYVCECGWEDEAPFTAPFPPSEGGTPSVEAASWVNDYLNRKGFYPSPVECYIAGKESAPSASAWSDEDRRLASFTAEKLLGDWTARAHLTHHQGDLIFRALRSIADGRKG